MVPLGTHASRISIFRHKLIGTGLFCWEAKFNFIEIGSVACFFVCVCFENGTGTMVGFGDNDPVLFKSRQCVLWRVAV